jgi:uncharacterized LabA/DUF88 family protein
VPEEIALFIDFENIRYSLLNIQRREPDPQELIGLARRYGTVMVARAYADWSRQPEQFKGSLMAAMIDRVDCPAKQRERVRTNWPASYANPFWNSGHAGAPASEATAGNGSTSLVGHEAAIELAREEGHSAMETPVPPPASAESPTRTPSGMAMPPAPVVQSTIIQSTVDLNMLMDIIETVFDRPSISTFVLMTGDKDFTRISARLKLRLNKRVIVVGIPGTVSRDLISSASEFVPLVPGVANVPATGATIEPTDPQFLQFLDYMDRNWSWRTIVGVSNFIGDPLNPKNRFRGRLTRETARELLANCIQQGVLQQQTDANGFENLRLNRQHPAVEEALRQFPR